MVYACRILCSDRLTLPPEMFNNNHVEGRNGPAQLIFEPTEPLRSIAT